MIKQYFKQVFINLHSQKMLSGIQILGTALAIFVIMVYVVMSQVRTAPFAPESHRDRFLHVAHCKLHSTDSTQGFASDGQFTIKVIRGCLQGMTVPEAITIHSSNDFQNISIPHGINLNAYVKGVDDGFWKVFDFSFIDGRPFNNGESESGQMVVILSESLAREFFGSESAVGKDVLVNKNAYHVVGVVEDVSPLANSAFAQAWIPYMSTASIEMSFNNGFVGGQMSATLLAHSTDEANDIREEFQKSVRQFNESIKGHNIMMEHINMPYDQEKTNSQGEGNNEPDMTHVHLIQLMIIIILLLVPTINLSSMTHSRFRQRITEIGIRRAFGATHGSILWQVIADNLVLTLLAGIVGFLFCILLAIFGGEWLFGSSHLAMLSAGVPLNIHIGMLMHASTFFLAFFFCLILNVLSSFIPAWKASRANIISALNKK